MTERDQDLRFFALDGSRDLGAAVARAGGFALALHEERAFEDGEHKARPLVGVRGADVYVLLSLAGGAGGSVNDRLCRLLFFIAACKENGAGRVTAITPYLAYARKDRQTKARDPVTTRYVAQLFEAVGTDRLVTLEAHNLAALQNAFRIETVHLDARRLYLPVVAALAGERPIAVVSPDGGGVKRAELLRELIERELERPAAFAFIEKRRSRGVVSGALFAGEVDGAAVFIVDDMISSGGTIRRAAEACRARGAAKLFGLAAHGLFGQGAGALFAGALDEVVVTDSVPNAALLAAADASLPLRIVSIAPLLAQAVSRLHAGGSISELLGLET